MTPTKFLLIYFLAIRLKLAELKLEPLSEEQEKLRYSLTECVLSAAKEFRYREVITMSLSIKDFYKYTNSTTATDIVLLEALYKKIEWTIFVTKSNNFDLPSTFFKKSDNYIIQFRHSDEFLSVLNFLMNRRSWNPHARFILLTSTIFPDPIPIISPIVENLWKVRVLNAIILMPRKNNSSKITVYSWFPYSSTNYGGGFDGIDVINICKYGKFFNNSLLFPNKISNNMDGFPVKVRTVIWPPFIMKPRKILNKHDVKFTKGIEIMLMNTIAKVANFTVIYSISDKDQDWGSINRKKTASGMMKTLLNEEVDVGLGALATLLYRHFYFDTSVTYHQESVTWCVPHALPEPKWKCLLIIFRKATWIALYFSYLFVSLIIKLLNLVNDTESINYQDVANIFQRTYSIMLGMTIPTLPRALRIRIVLMIWICVCLILNAAYHSSLISFLTKPYFETQIESLDEMIKAGYKFGVVPPSFLFMKNAASNLNQSNFESCDNVKLCLDRTAYHRDFAVGVPRMYMVYASRAYTTNTGEELVYWTKDDIVSYPIEMIMVKGFPLLTRINEIIFRIVEAGLLSKWSEEFLNKNAKLDSKHKKISDRFDDDVILSIHHLEGAFIILLIGLCFSGTVLILEILYFKYFAYKYKMKFLH